MSLNDSTSGDLLRTQAKMLAGELYCSADSELVSDAERVQRLVAQYNAATGETGDVRLALLRLLCSSVGDGTVVRSPFACDYGYNIGLGWNAFINFTAVVGNPARIIRILDDHKDIEM